MPDIKKKSAWFTVLSTGTSPEAVEKYLYSHTEIALLQVVSRFGRDTLAALLETTADTQEEAERLAQYQADRLNSGLLGASAVFPHAFDALTALEERTGVRL